MKGDETGARWGVLSSCWRLGSTLAILWLVGLSACARTQHPMGLPPEEPRPGARVPYVIGVTDRLTIAVWKNSELSIQVFVRSDGKISVPLLDDVQAEGLTPEELKEVITQELSEYVSAPDVTVIVSGMNSKTAMPADRYRVREWRGGPPRGSAFFDDPSHRFLPDGEFEGKGRRGRLRRSL